jgi:nitrate/TMAO reductase-like tetraheme cytochrome c subunit
LTAARKNSMENEERKENRIYYCRQCHAFHLTSKDRLPFNQNV